MNATNESRSPFFGWRCLLVSCGVVFALASVARVYATGTVGDSVPTAISSGSVHTCALQSDGTVVCWGNNDDNQASPLPGLYQQVEAGAGHTCAIKTDNTLACWGANDSGEATPPPGSFSQVSAGVEYSCGVRTDGTVICWGLDDDDQASPLPGSYQQVTTGTYHACGIKTDGTLACWGFNDDGQATAQPGTFLQVSAGEYHTCGIKAGGALACWGYNGEGQASPPSGSFLQVSAGTYHTCALRSDKTLACWGENSDGQAAPPAGIFLQVSAGDYHSCGLRSDSLVVCWGDNIDGQAPVIRLDPATLPVGTVGVAYSQVISVTAEDYTSAAPLFNLVAGSLPPGLSLNSTTGLLNGSATLGGQFIFTVQVIDANGLSGQHEYTLRINRPPTANQQNVATGQDSAKVIILSASDADGDRLTYTVLSSPSQGTLSSTPPALTYTPAAGFSGTDSFTFKANDGRVDSNIATVTITIFPNPPSNTPPQANDLTITTARNITAALTLAGSDAEGNPLTFTLVSQPVHGTLSGSLPQLSYTPDTDFVGVDTFVYQANDGHVDSNLATVTLQVLANNTPPVAHNQDLITLTNTPLTVTLTAADDDGDTLAFVLIDMPTLGSLSGTAPNLIYTPNPDVLGVDHLSFKVNDGLVDSTPATITMTVKPNVPLNAKPQANAQRISTIRNTAKAIKLTATDADGDALTYRLLGDPEHGVLSGEAPNLLYTPAPGFSGSDSFAFTVNDGQVESNAALVTITVLASNSPPVANPQQVTVANNAAKAVTLTASDADGDALAYTVLSQPAQGTLSGSAPALIYTPATDFTGTDSFTFQVNDGQSNSNSATVTLTVLADQPVNLPPIANDQTVNTEQDTAATVTLTASDPNGDPLDYTIVSTPTHGTLSGTAPSLSYTPASGYSGTDSFTFKVNDGQVDSNVATVLINIAGVSTQASITGIIYNDKNGNGQKESDELGIQAAKVLLSDSSGGLTAAATGGSNAERTTFTNTDGVYRFDQVPLGAYTLRVEPPTGYILAGESQVLIVVGDTGAVTTPPLALQQTARTFLPLIDQ